MSFLNKLNSVVVETPAKERKPGGNRKQWNPTEADIRVWKDGSVFPSEAFVKRFGLEYDVEKNEKGSVIVGNGLDVFLSSNYAGIKTPGDLKIVMVAAVSRTQGKVDLFATVGLDEEGNANVSVLDQGATTFGKNELLPMLKEAYGIELGEDKEYVDLIVAGHGEKNDQPFRNANNSPVYYVPKTVSRGERKGETTVQRRENLDLFALVPYEKGDAGITAPPAEEKEESIADKALRMEQQSATV